jgi:hypothetical protein
MKADQKTHFWLYASTSPGLQVMLELQTSQDFVKALKSSSDPPFADGPTKIEIARSTWDNCSFYAPRKGEVITEWILGLLMKEKERR